MDACHCGAGPQSAITFAGQVEMLRCRLCGTTSWTLEGRRVSHDVAHSALRGTFVSTRRQAPGPRAPRPPRVLDLREAHEQQPAPSTPAPAEPLVPEDVEGALAEVMRAKGLSGSWTVSG